MQAGLRNTLLSNLNNQKDSIMHKTHTVKCLSSLIITEYVRPMGTEQVIFS